MVPDNRHVAFRQEDGKRAGWVQRQEFPAAQPGLLLDQREFLAILAEGNADEAAGSEDRMMKEGEH